MNELQSWLGQVGLNGLLVPSTDEYLSEFSPPCSRRLQWATGFDGSVGLAVILRDAAAVFLDSRYLSQARAQLHGPFAIEPATVEARSGWLSQRLAPGARLAIDPWLHAAPDFVEWQTLSTRLGLQLHVLGQNPIDELWRTGRPARHRPATVDYPVAYAGERHEAKCDALVEHVRAAGLNALLLPDPEDVSWLLNVRASRDAIRVAAGDWHIVPSCPSRALIARDGTVTWFIDESQLSREVRERGAQRLTIAAPGDLIPMLHAVAARGPVGVDLRRTPAILSSVLEEHGALREDDVVARRRWRKHPVEIESARRIHKLDAAAVVRLMAWLAQAIHEQAITEFDIAERIEQLRREHPDYLGPSEPVMCASGASGAQPHYIPQLTACRRLNDYAIFWMDSGGQYLGGTTDNTITMALATPDLEHVRVHTSVLRGFIALATSRAPARSAASRLDPLARQELWRDGLDYPHGTGHGVGNCLNIHEGPLITRNPGPLASVPLEPGMIVTNEPGYYSPGRFGLRIECHMVVVDSSHAEFVEFDVISRLPIDPRLVDFERLSRAEKRWLADYHQVVLNDLAPLLDGVTRRWLSEFVEVFSQRAD